MLISSVYLVIGVWPLQVVQGASKATWKSREMLIFIEQISTQTTKSNHNQHLSFFQKTVTSTCVEFLAAGITSIGHINIMSQHFSCAAYFDKQHMQAVKLDPMG